MKRLVKRLLAVTLVATAIEFPARGTECQLTPADDV